MDLTPKQKAFCEHYAACGNAVEAARRAGYKTPNPEGARLLGKPGVVEYLRTLTTPAQQGRIATAQERQEWWTKVMRGELDGDGGPDWSHKLKASELLGKAQADFVERQEISGKDGGALPMIEVVFRKSEPKE